MSDLGTMKTRIAREIVRDDLSTEIGEAIATAVETWAGQRFWFNEKRFALTTVADQEYYAMSALTLADGTALQTGEGLIEIDSFTLTYNNEPYPLHERSQAYLDDQQSPAATYTGQPWAYGIYEDKIRLHPIPDAAYGCVIAGLASLPSLTSDGATNAWMTSGEALIRQQAKLIIYRDITRDPDGVALAERGLAEALENLRRRTFAKVATGRIAPWGNV